MITKTIYLKSENETILFGEKICSVLPKGSVCCLRGDLGAGKTTFTKGIAKSLKITEPVLSPTFNIMKTYLKGKIPLVHIDAYRLKDNNVDIGLDEFIGIENGLTIIEWPDFIKDLLPSDVVDIKIMFNNESTRKCLITFDEVKYKELFKWLQSY